MAIFRYEVADANGKVLRGAMDAASPQEVDHRLTAQGYRVLELQGGTASGSTSTRSTPYRSAVIPPEPSVAPFTGPTARPDQLGNFFRQLASLIHSGFSVSNAFSDLGMRISNSDLAGVSKAIGMATASGASLAGEMAKYPTLFPPHVIGLTAAGETGGFLEFAFEEAALNQEQDAALGQGLWLARLLIWQSIWSVLILQPFFPNVHVEDMRASAVAYGHALVFIAIPIGILLHVASYFGGKMWKQPWARRFHDSVSLRIPVMARLAKMRALAAFTRVLRRLLMSGISPEPAFAAAARSVPNILLSEQILTQGGPIVRAHQGIDSAIAATGLMGDDPLQMLITGQKTGQWMEMLDRVTAFYQDEAARATDAAKSAQKRAGVIITLISMGYVLIVGTWGGYKVMWQFLDTFEK